MTTIRSFSGLALVSALALMNSGCLGRAIDEGVGVVTGASGKVVNMTAPGGLEKYRGLQVESITVSQGMRAPAELAALIKTEFAKAAARKGLTPGGRPGLLVSGEITNFESADAVDTAIGPLEEVIVRAKLMDAETREVLGIANLIGRAKSTSSGGAEHLSEGAAKAFRKWLTKGGIKKGEEDEKEK